MGDKPVVSVSSTICRVGEFNIDNCNSFLHTDEGFCLKNLQSSDNVGEYNMIYLLFLSLIFCPVVVHCANANLCVGKESPGLFVSQAGFSVPDYVNRYSETVVGRGGVRYYLLPLYEAYFPALAAIKSDADVMQNNQGDHNTPPALNMTRQWTAIGGQAWELFAHKDAKGSPKLSSSLRYMIVRDDGCCVGECGLQRDSETGRSSIFYNLLPGARGKGIGSSVARALVGIFFKLFPSEQTLYVYFLVGNTPSRKTAEKAGFTPHKVKGQAMQKTLDGRLYDFYSISRKRAI